MGLRLKGKRAFVSGSTQGIGYATAKVLLAEGVEVMVNGRSAERVIVAVHELSAATCGEPSPGWWLTSPMPSRC